MSRQSTLNAFLAAPAAAPAAAAAAAADPAADAQPTAAAAAAATHSRPTRVRTQVNPPAAAAAAAATSKPKPKKSKTAAKDEPAEAESSASSAAAASAASSSAAAALMEDDDAAFECEEESAGDSHHCGVCEGRGELLLCDGPCGRAFHAACMPECPDSAEGCEWFCQECRDKEHECFICKQPGKDNEEVFLCSIAVCGKFYHKECVADHPLRGKSQDDGSFVCPRHKCATCHLTLLREKHLKCLRCVNSFHTCKGRCIPHKSVYQFKSGDYMLCNTDMETLNFTTDRSEEDEEGFEEDQDLPDLPLPVMEAFNPFAIPVEQLDAAAAAVPAVDAASAAPMEDVASSAAPVAAADSAASSSSAAAAASASASSSSSSAAAAASTSASAAPARVSLFFPSALWTPPNVIKDFTVSRGMIAAADNFVPKPRRIPKGIPPYFKRIAANQYGEFVSKPTFKVESEPCMCLEQKDQCEENCINRAMYVECTRKCPLGENCHNQRLSRRQYAKTAVILTDKRGWGLVAKEDIPSGSLIIEYLGEMIDDDECTRRLNQTLETGKKDYYFFKLSDDLVIDAGPMGNNARFLNHACSPNCKTEMWSIGAQQRVGIFAIKDVPKGQELTYDYNFEGFWQPGAALKCECGSPNCAGTLGGKKKSKEDIAKEAAKAAKEAAAAGKKKPAAKAAAAASSSSSSSSAAAAAASSSSSSSSKSSGAAPAAKKPAPKKQKVEAAPAAAAAAAPVAPPKKRGPPVDRSSNSSSNNKHTAASAKSAANQADVKMEAAAQMEDDDAREERKESCSD